MHVNYQHTDSEVGKVINSIKAAKASENHVQGQISKEVDFRKALTEIGHYRKM